MLGVQKNDGKLASAPGRRAHFIVVLPIPPEDSSRYVQEVWKESGVSAHGSRITRVWRRDTLHNSLRVERFVCADASDGGGGGGAPLRRWSQQGAGQLQVYLVPMASGRSAALLCVQPRCVTAWSQARHGAASSGTQEKDQGGDARGFAAAPPGAPPA